MSVHDVPRLIALTLVAASSGGCGWLFGCGPDRSTETPMSLDDWTVTSSRYTSMMMAAEDWQGGTGGLPGDADIGDTGDTGETGGSTETWDGFDETQKCNFACAYALGQLENYNPSYTNYHELTIHTCELTIPVGDEDGSLTCTATLYFTDVCIGGRRPQGWHAERAPIGRELDGMAMMEHVSITAFLELAAQLETHGAPIDLIARCRAAADDERHHVELLIEIGAERPSATLVSAAATSSLLEIARHNAVEGCVIETWAALLARHQSERAPEPCVRRAFERIADDEARHAQLAWELHAWFVEALDPAAAAEIEAARAQALARLERAALQQALVVPREVRETLGLPDPRLASMLANDFGRRLAQRHAA